MRTVTEIQALAQKRLKEADVLISNTYYDGALAGYAVELMLKARICKHLEIENFYSAKQEDQIKRAYYVHKLEQLLTFYLG